MTKFVKDYGSEEGRFIRVDSIREIHISREGAKLRGHVHVFAYTDDHERTEDGYWIGKPVHIGWSLSRDRELPPFLSELGVVNP